MAHEPRGPLQFRLRSIFWALTLLSMLCAAMTAVGPIWSVVLLLLVSLIAAHVIGNSIGTRLRDEATRHYGEELPAAAQQTRPREAALGSSLPTRLGARRPLGQSIFVFTLAGAVLGALVGRAALYYGGWGQLSANDWALGIASTAVLGGLAGFIASGFLQEAIWPAVKFFFRDEHAEIGKRKSDVGNHKAATGGRGD